MHCVGGLRCGAAAELSGIGVRAELGMEVRDGDPEISILVAPSWGTAFYRAVTVTDTVKGVFQFDLRQVHIRLVN
jgi:hypothetical protein